MEYELCIREAEISDACPKNNAAPKINRSEFTTNAKLNWMFESHVMKRTALRTLS